jgi:4-alpha-glucanotransferase
VPGRELFTSVEKELGELPVIAEDLGDITPEVLRLRDDMGFPGMKVLQFAFGGDAGNLDLPHNYRRHSVVYTGTHDNDTLLGWWASLETDAPHVREHALRYLASDGEEINWDMIRAAWSSVAKFAITPAQDLLGLGTKARMNFPSTLGGNWSWRMRPEAITPEIVDRLRDMTVLFGRTRAG